MVLAYMRRMQWSIYHKFVFGDLVADGGEGLERKEKLDIWAENC